MYESVRTFDLNTCITALNSEGEFDKKAHAEAVKPVFLRIKLHDGITSCFISQYAIKVEFYADVISMEKVAKIVRDAVRWAADNEDLKLFPLRGTKKPRVIRKAETTRKPSRLKDVVVQCNSSVVVYMPSATENGARDDAEFTRMTYVLAQQLSNADGVVWCKIYSDGARLRFDTTITTAEAIQTHMEHVLRRAKVNPSQVFPFLRSADELRLTFRVEDAS